MASAKKRWESAGTTQDTELPKKKGDDRGDIKNSGKEQGQHIGC